MNRETQELLVQPDPNGPKPTKPPINPHRDIYGPVKARMASVTDPRTWGTYQQAAKRLLQGRKGAGYRGLGYVFSKEDPFCGIDLDNARNPETGEIAPWAQKVIHDLNSYTENSVSETGFHILIEGSLAQLAEDMGFSLDKLKHKHPKGIELYDDLHFFTVSNKHLEGTPTTIEKRQEALENLYFETFFIQEDEDDERPDQENAPQRSSLSEQEKHRERGASAARTDEPAAAGIRFDLPDDFIIEQAVKARGGRGAIFERLWAGDASDFPAAEGKKDDTSRADLALCGIFAYWTRCDAYQMDRLFRKSGLYSKSEERRNKWDRVGDRTIALAIRNCRSMYNPVWADEHRATRTNQRAQKKQAQAGKDEQEQQQEKSQDEHHKTQQETQKHAFTHIETTTQADKDAAHTEASQPKRIATYAEHRATLDASLERMRRGLIQKLDAPGDTKIYLVARPPGTGKTHAIAEMGDPVTGTYNFASFFERHDMALSVPALSNYLVREACNKTNCPHHDLANALGAMSRNTYSVHSKEAVHCAFSQQDKNTSASKIYMDAHAKLKAPARHQAIWKDEIDLARVIVHKYFTSCELQAEYKAKYTPGSTAHSFELALDMIVQEVTARELARRKQNKAALASGKKLTRRERAALTRSKPVELTAPDLFLAAERFAHSQHQSLEGWLISLSQHDEYTNTHPYEEVDPNDPTALYHIGTLPPLCLPYIARAMIAELEEWQYYQASGERWNGHVGVVLSSKGYGISVTEMPQLPCDEQGHTPLAVFSDGTAKTKYISLAYNIPEQLITEDREKLFVAPGTRLVEPSNSPRYGKTDLNRAKIDPATGTASYPDRDRAIAHARFLLKKHDPTGAELAAGRIGLITFKGAVESIGDALGIKEERRMWFWGSRGSNKLADCSLLLLIGTPTMRPNETIAQARDLYRYDPAEISDKWECDPATGRPRYTDGRVQELCEDQINNEATQCAHRVRPIQYENKCILHLGHSQIGDMHGAELISDPLPSQVTFQGQARKDANLEVALSRLVLAYADLQQNAIRITTRSLQAKSGVQMALVCRWLRDQREQPTDVSESAIKLTSSLGNIQTNDHEEQRVHSGAREVQLSLTFAETHVSQENETIPSLSCVTPSVHKEPVGERLRSVFQKSADAPPQKSVLEFTDNELDGVIAEYSAQVGYPSLVSRHFSLEEGVTGWKSFLQAATTTRAMRESVYHVLVAWVA